MCASADFAQFTLVQCDDGGYCCCGVARPDWDVQSRDAVGARESDIGDCCFYVSDSGACWPTIEFEGGDWDGQSGSIEGDRIGMLLDLDSVGADEDGRQWRGSLTVYKNDRLLGTMATGLVGKFCCKSGLLHGPQYHTVVLRATVSLLLPNPSLTSTCCECELNCGVVRGRDRESLK